jgi:hypothetical protein
MQVRLHYPAHPGLAGEFFTLLAKLLFGPFEALLTLAIQGFD